MGIGALEDAASGEDGILAGVTSGATWVDVSTVSPRVSRQLQLLRTDYQLTAAGKRALSGKRSAWLEFTATISAALEGRPCPDPA